MSEDSSRRRSRSRQGTASIQDLAPQLASAKHELESQGRSSAQGLEGRSAVDPALLQDLPLPIAHGAMVVAAQLSPEGRILALVNAFRCIVRFLGLVGAAHYLRYGEPNPDTDKALRDCFSPRGKKMYDGEWIRILRESLLPFAVNPQASRIPGLVSFFFRGRKEPTPEAHALEEWGHFRNRVHHPELEKNPVKVGERLEKWLPILAGTLRGLGFLSRYELLQPIKVSLNPPRVRSARIFRGPSLSVRYLEGMSLPLTAKISDPEQTVLWVSLNAPERQVLLTPFVRVTEDGTLLILREILKSRGVPHNASFVTAADSRDGGLLVGTPYGKEHFGELMELLARLENIGIPRRPTKLKARGYRVGEDPWTGIERWAAAWEQSEQAYEIILELGAEKELQDAIANVSAWTKARSVTVEAFALLTAIHYRLAWLAWVKRTSGNRLAARSLLSLLDVGNRYHRPRLRALYALQGSNRDLLTEVLVEGDWEPKTVAIVERHVLKGHVKDYLRHLASQSGPHPLPLRAEEVLSEVEPTGGGGVDLPLGPDFDAEVEGDTAT